MSPPPCGNNQSRSSNLLADLEELLRHLGLRNVQVTRSEYVGVLLDEDKLLVAYAGPRVRVVAGVPFGAGCELVVVGDEVLQVTRFGLALDDALAVLRQGCARTVVILIS